MSDYNLPDELPEDPSAASGAERESITPTSGSEAGESAYALKDETVAHRQEHPTGEHPSIEEHIDTVRAVFLSGSSERVSAPHHEKEPEDNLPDLLDRNK